ncbi:hypothetical protein [Gynuella sp.]|jgi:hypothetical protein|uniref:hypothetical protein n=1 Tax=Gynuella sp. TaxID=2969146 RepID=UPI003D0AFC71
MKRYLVFFSTLCLFSAAVAENRGIEETNYSVLGSVSDADSGSRMSLTGLARVPITNYTGASITGRYSDFNGKNSYIDSSTNSFGLGVFVRDYDLGIINASYVYSRTEADSSNSKNSIDSISLSGTYYYKAFDLGLGRSKAKADTGSSFNTSRTSVSYYVNENLKVGATVIKMDADDTDYFISYQPHAFGNVAALSMAYQDSSTNDTLTISLAYYFDTRVSLKDRARRY